jgi:ABC-2 type transport system ATP-binding protein
VIANDTPARLKARLGSTVLELAFPDPAVAERALGLLAPTGAGAPELEGTTVRVNVQDGARVVVDVLRALDAGGVVPAGLTVREPSLDDVFLALTGHHAERAEETG